MSLSCHCGSDSFDVEFASPLLARITSGVMQVAQIETPTMQTPVAVRCAKCGSVERNLDYHPYINAEALRRYAVALGLNQDVTLYRRDDASNAEAAAMVSADGMLDAIERAGEDAA